jgi:hypothetical protein
MKYVEIRWDNAFASATLPDELVSEWLSKTVVKMYEENGLEVSSFVSVAGHSFDRS